MLSSRLNAFVIPTSHATAERDRDPVARDDLDRQAAGERDRGRAELRASLAHAGQCPEIVDEAGQEEQRAPAEHAPELAVGSTTSRPTATSTPVVSRCDQAETADDRRLALVPAVVARGRGEATGEG